jgi:Predicted dehydrogenase related to H2-forming N5,N10-methylenetetrahydromethanopterin dehydrogenase
MDLCLYSSSPSIRLRPGTVHGMLWLQTHFEAEHWDLLADGLVTLPSADAEALRHDAIAAVCSESASGPFGNQTDLTHCP